MEEYSRTGEPQSPPHSHANQQSQIDAPRGTDKHTNENFSETSQVAEGGCKNRPGLMVKNQNDLLSSPSASSVARISLMRAGCSGCG